jgi:hypothetical protein
MAPHTKLKENGKDTGDQRIDEHPLSHLSNTHR